MKNIFYLFKKRIKFIIFLNMNNKKEKEQSIKIQFQSQHCSIKFNHKNTISGLKKYIKDKFKISEKINNYYFYSILPDNIEIKIEDDKILSQYIFDHNLVNFIFRKDENIKETISDCDKKYNNLEEKYNELEKKYIELLNKEIKNEKKIEEQELKINKLFKLIDEKQLKEKDEKFSIFDEQILAKNDINIYNNEITSLNNIKLDVKKENENKRIEPSNEITNSPKKEKSVYNNIITNPGIICQIIFNEKDMPMILKSKINNIITFNLQIKNIGSLDLPKNCKLINRNGTSNLKIINPEVNVIKIGEIINFKLNLKFIDFNNIKENNDIELAIHSEAFGLLSNWSQLNIYVKDDSNNILIKNK